jgi:hypothetical protein
MPKKKFLPKRVAGVKLPKPLRKGGSRFLRSPEGRKLAMEAVAATAALVAAGVGARKGLLKQAASRGIGAADAAAAASSMTSAFDYAVSEGVRSFTEALKSGKTAAGAETAWPPVEEDGPAKKKPARTDAPTSAH